MRLTLAHRGLDDLHEREGTAAGWIKALSSLKTFVESGRTLSGLW